MLPHRALADSSKKKSLEHHNIEKERTKKEGRGRERKRERLRGQLVGMLVIN